MNDELRECVGSRNGEDGRGLLKEDDDSLDWKRKSNGRWAGLGLDLTEVRKAKALLLGDDCSDP